MWHMQGLGQRACSMWHMQGVSQRGCLRHEGSGQSACILLMRGQHSAAQLGSPSHQLARPAQLGARSSELGARSSELGARSSEDHPGTPHACERHASIVDQHVDASGLRYHRLDGHLAGGCVLDVQLQQRAATLLQAAHRAHAAGGGKHLRSP